MIYNAEVVDVHLRRLRAFVVVAEELHFTRAATRLFVAQQSLSRQIAELETAIGTPLLHRTSRRVELTAAGEAFLVAVTETLDRFDRGVAQARALGDQTSGVLRVGFITGAALELTAPILSSFTAAHPEVQIELHEYGLADPSAGAGSDSDVAFIRLPSTTTDLVTHRLFSEPCVVGVSGRHRLASNSRVRVSDLLAETLAVGCTDDHAWRDFWILADYRADGDTPRLVETTSQSEELEVVSAGLACTVTPAAAARYAPHPGIRFIPIDDSPRSVVALAHRAGPLDPTVRAFVANALAVRDDERDLVAGIENPQ